jgi:hypothetical protein
VLQNKVNTLDKKIEDLNAQKKKIETDIAHQLLQVIKSHSGFTLPFHALVGGLIDVIQTIKSGPKKMEEWQGAGEKFLKHRSRSSPRPRQSSSSTAKIG